MIGDRPYARSIRWTWIAAIWVAGALCDAIQTSLTMHAEGGGRAGLLPFAIEFVSWLPWAVATPFIIKVARRRPFVRGGIWKALPIHLATFAAVSSAAEAWSAMLRVMFNPWRHHRPPVFLDSWATLILLQIVTFAIVYALILTVTYVIDYRDGLARQMTEAARLNEDLSRAQLAALRRQMDPHFMFNTLNSIAGLVRDQRNDEGVRMIVGLSEFLRRSSADSHRPRVTLAEEVDYLQRYIDIQKVRFGERLRVSLDIPVDLLDAQVPSLLLQPLVENAIKHGISKRVSGGKIKVTGTSHGGMLHLTVFNDGPWDQEDLDAASGVGLDNLRNRLRILHGDQAELLLRPAEAGGLEVVVMLPFREM